MEKRMNQTTEELTNEQQDSIKVSKNSKGHTWEIKRYYDFSKAKPKDIIEQIEKIDEELKKKFGGEE